MNTISPQEQEARHPVGGLVIPKDLNDLPVLKFSSNQFVAPRTVYCMDWFLPAKDQGKKPWCAGYSAAAFLENILWRRDDVPQKVDPTWIYQWAKKHDGNPDADGTTLIAVLDALRAHQCFPADKCPVKILRTIDQVKYAIHKYGCCMLGLNISREWYACNCNKTAIYGQEGCDQSLIGGHAVVAGGMDNTSIFILNSWGEDWASYGRVLLSWEELRRQFVYGAVIENCLVDVRMN